MDVMWVLVAAGVLLIFGAWHLYQRRANAPVDLLADVEYIVTLLNTTIDARNNFEIVFDTDVPGMDKRFNGSCIACNTQTFLIDTNIGYSVPSWAGQAVNVLFSLGKGPRVHMYECHSSIQRVIPYREGYALELVLPKKLILIQRRAFLRLAPPSGLVARISLWHKPAIDGRLVISGIPVADATQPVLHLNNISAGGAGLRLPKHYPRVDALSPGEQILVRFELRDNEGNSTLMLWVIATIIMSRETTKNVTFAVRFTKWIIEGDPEQELTWFPVNAGMGIPPLASWVMRRDLELHKTQLA